jgi:TetR/AcrR family transcriptional regulator, transcriptional repressor for nem operon
LTPPFDSKYDKHNIMPYPKTHKPKVRGEILVAAARAFRQKGIQGVSVPEVMKAAGLTHGGFYAHFANKEQLVAESVRHGLGETWAAFAQMLEATPPPERLSLLVNHYLSRSHRDHPESGCALPILSPELGRHSPEVRAALGESLEGILRQLGGWMTGKTEAERQEQAVLALSSMIGAMVLARAVSNPQLSDEILRLNRKNLKENL